MWSLYNVKNISKINAEFLLTVWVSQIIIINLLSDLNMLVNWTEYAC